MTPHIKHILLGLLTAVVLLLITWKVIAWQGNIAHDQRVLAEEKLKNDLAIAKTQAQTTQTDTTALQNQVNRLTASNSALVASVAFLKSELADQRAKDAAASPTDLSVRWRAIVGVGQITATAQGILSDLPAAHETVDELEQLSEAEAELAQVKANSGLKDSALAAQTQVLVDTQAELATCKAVKVDTDAACKAQVAEVKATARKHSLIYAIGAFIGGIVFGRKL